MAQERLSMRKAKEVLRLYFGLGLSKRQVARSCKVSPSTVVEYIHRAEHAGVGWPLPENIDDTTLESLLFPIGQASRWLPRQQPDFQSIHRELRKKGVTLQLLWQEYKEHYPEGYAYSQFCLHYHDWSKTLDIALRQEYRAGEKLFVDFAGSTIGVTNPVTGQITTAQIFVAALGASNYTYAEAAPDQSLRSWIGCHVRALEYLNGVPEIIIPDNLKAAVSKACRYEPDLNPTYRDMAEHYGTVIIPARAGKPRDKAKVEAAVLMVTRWIIAALRKRTFFNLADLNKTIGELLERLNTRPFRKLQGNRRALFESIDKPALKPLPFTRYQYAEWKKATVSIDYHIEVQGHYYSVPYQLIKKSVDVRMTTEMIEVFFKAKRVALHKRNDIKGSFTTDPVHRPAAHQRHLEWTPSRLINWAAKMGPATATLIEHILTTRIHPEQSYRTCMGILRLAKRYSPERLEASCTRALSIKAHSYWSVKSILEHGFDRLPVTDDKKVTPVIEHDNIRGSKYYN